MMSYNIMKTLKNASLFLESNPKSEAMDEVIDDRFPAEDLEEEDILDETGFFFFSPPLSFLSLTFSSSSEDVLSESTKFTCDVRFLLSVALLVFFLRIDFT